MTMNEPKSTLILLRVQWQKVKKLLTHNWKPKYLCLLAASVVWGAVFWATKKDTIDSWKSDEEPYDPTSEINSQNTHPRPAEAKPEKKKIK